VKVIFGTFAFVVAVLVTGGMYLFVRKDNDKKSDLNKLRQIPGAIAKTWQDLVKYTTELFSSKSADEAQAA
jgi:hypothetical protein